MKRQGWFSGIAAIVVGGGIAVSAQSPPSPANSQADQKSITVTGCLQPASAAAGTTGTAGTTATGTTSSSSTASDRFMLTNARVGAGMSSSTAGSTTGSTGATTSGTTGATTAGAATGRAMDTTGATYILEGKTSDLPNHVNHQVEITGKLDPSNSTSGSSATASGSTTAGTPTSGAGRPAADSQRLQVESVKMVAATCSAR